MPDTNKPAGVRFGVKSVHYAILDETAGTYGTPKPIPGAAKLTLSPVGSSNTAYYDDMPYETFDTNGGYNVSFEGAYLTDDMKVDLLGYKKDANGVVYEPTDAKPPYIALLWLFEGSKMDKAGLLYKVKFTRPSEEGNTKTDTVNPDNDTISGAAVGKDIEIGGKKENVVKASCLSTIDKAAVFANWFKKVYTIGETIA